MAYPKRKTYNELTEDDKNAILHQYYKDIAIQDIGGDLQIKTTAIRQVVEDHTNNQPEGLGDTVHNVLNSKVLSGTTNFIKGILFKDEEDCGCDERREQLNKIFKYKRKPLWLTKDEFKWFTEFNKRANKHKLTREDQIFIADTHSRVFQYQLKKYPCTCTPQVYTGYFKELMKIYNNLKDEFENEIEK